MISVNNDWLEYYTKHVEHAIDFYVGAYIYFYFLPFNTISIIRFSIFFNSCFINTYNIFITYFINLLL
jgi:hypothetical protein